MIALQTVVHAQKFAALDLQPNGPVAVRDNLGRRIQQRHLQLDDAPPVGRDARDIRRDTDRHGFPDRPDHLARDLMALKVPPDRHDFIRA